MFYLSSIGISYSINIQVKTISSAFTLNYNFPGHSRSDIPSRREDETVNYSQINDTKLKKCSVRGDGALLNLGNQTLPKSEMSNITTNDSFNNDGYPEARRRDDARPSRSRNGGDSGNPTQSIMPLITDQLLKKLLIIITDRLLKKLLIPITDRPLKKLLIFLTDRLLKKHLILIIHRLLRI